MEDYGTRYIMPGLVDVHTHLAFGNAQSEEDIDLWTSDEFRALRGMFFAQHVLAARRQESGNDSLQRPQCS